VRLFGPSRQDEATISAVTGTFSDPRAWLTASVGASVGRPRNRPQTLAASALIVGRAIGMGPDG
jgi:hypothetical protein